MYCGENVRTIACIYVEFMRKKCKWVLGRTDVPLRRNVIMTGVANWMRAKRVGEIVR